MLPLLYFYTVSFTDWFGDNIALLLVRRPTETNTICIAGIPLLPESILHFWQFCRFFLHIYTGSWQSRALCKSTSKFCQQDLDARYLHRPGETTKLCTNYQLTIFQNQGYKSETTNLLHQASFFKVRKRKENPTISFKGSTTQAWSALKLAWTMTLDVPWTFADFLLTIRLICWRSSLMGTWETDTESLMSLNRSAE